jgi:hypothetical protein
VGVEWFSSAVALAGPDAVLDWAMHPALTLSMHIGLRAVIADGGVAERGVMTDGGAWLRFRLTGDDNGGMGVTTGLDALALANSAGDLRVTLVPGAALAGWYALASGCRLAVDGGGGAALMRLQLPSGSAIGGVELRSRVSLMVDF